MVNIVRNDFIIAHVKDSLHGDIVKEVSNAKDPKRRGRKIELTAEKLHNFLFYLSIGNNYKNAAVLAQIPENTRQKYMAKSETFRRVTSLAKDNLTCLAVEAIYEAIKGRKSGYVQYIHPETHETLCLFQKEILPNLNTAKWYLETTGYFKEKSGEAEVNQLVVPQNEHEVDLMVDLLNRHYDYIQGMKESQIDLNN